MNDTVNAKSFLSFHLEFMLLMLSSGREEEANRSLRMIAEAVAELPEDLLINKPQENTNNG